MASYKYTPIRSQCHDDDDEPLFKVRDDDENSLTFQGNQSNEPTTDSLRTKCMRNKKKYCIISGVIIFIALCTLVPTIVVLSHSKKVKINTPLIPQLFSGGDDPAKINFNKCGNIKDRKGTAWFVGIEVHGRYLCTGTLITNRFVLIPAKCLFKTTRNSEQYTAAELEVNFGFYEFLPHLNTLTTGSVKKLSIHPEYHIGEKSYNFALIEMEEPIEFNTKRSPICLPTPDTDMETLPVSSGYRIYHYDGNRIENHYKVEILPLSECVELYDIPENSNASLFCAKIENIARVVNKKFLEGPLIIFDEKLESYIQIGNVFKPTKVAKNRNIYLTSKVTSIWQWIDQEVAGLS